MTTEEDSTSSGPNEHEDPSLSSASLCIQFDLLGERFGPAFTHQAFRGEWIRGYHPPLATLKELTDKATANLEDPSKKVLLHSSHVHHETATKELSIVVNLTPACEECQVEICTERKRLPRRQSVRASKRRRTENPADDKNVSNIEDAADEENDDEDNEEGNDSDSEADYQEEDDNDDEEDNDSEFEADGEVSEVEEEVDKEGSTRKSRMPTKEIVHCMKKGLPAVIETKNNQGRFLKRPLGVELEEYTINGKDFLLCLANGSEASKYHGEVQRLALWFIETADDVDVASKEGGFWKVLYLFQKHQRNQYSLAGYITLFYFHAPFKKPRPGYVVRICQALVLPPFQRSGHGKRMLTCVFDIAHGLHAEKMKASTNNEGEGDDEIVEINVESPAPAFVMLRNRTDYDCFRRSVDKEDPWFPIGTNETVRDETFFIALSEPEVTLAASKAKIIPRQIQIVQELFKLQKLQEHLKSEGKDQEEELEKRFRLMVKKRLNKEHREDLSGFRTKAEKQAFLEEEFKKCLESYQITLPRIKG